MESMRTRGPRFSPTKKFAGEVFTLRDPGGYASNRREARRIAKFVRGLGKRARICPIQARGYAGYLIYQRG